MRAYLVLTMCSVTAALPASLPPFTTLTPRFDFLPLLSDQRLLKTADSKKGEESTTEVPVLDLNQFCDLLESDEQKNECLDYVRRNVKPAAKPIHKPAAEGPLEKNKVRNNGERVPLDLQVFVPSENSWYLQDSQNHKFLGRPLVNVDKRPETASTSTVIEKRNQESVIRLSRRR